MYSLLTEELKNNKFNLNREINEKLNKEINKNLNIKINENKNDNICKLNDSPINNKDADNEYRLNINHFDPAKFSPPNEWQCRLIKRINSFTHIHDTKM